MAASYSLSANIVRDSGKNLDYIVTPNAERTAIQLIEDFKKGFRAFTIIGSFGTGKSSFLRAFEQSLTKKQELFEIVLPKAIEKVQFLNIVGEFRSIEQVFCERFQISEQNSTALFKALEKQWKNIHKTSGLWVIAIDEFGKFLEYAAKNQPEKEMYFIQQLAEFANDPDKNIVLVTTLHQNVDAYALDLTVTQRNEWKKINGRLKELTFNEPIEQLLTLASAYFKVLTETKPETAYTGALTAVQKANNIFSTKSDFFEQIGNELYPMDIFSAYVLTMALQKYGQNERSLFSFLQSTDNLSLLGLEENEFFSLPEVYNYLYLNFYSFLNSKANPDYAHWFSIKQSVEYVDVTFESEQSLAADLVKTIGLFQVFGNKGSAIDDEFLLTYFSNRNDKSTIAQALENLIKKQIIRFNKFSRSFRLYEGSDFDIDEALHKAANQIERTGNLVGKLNNWFDFPIEQAKAASYMTGTPRLFEYVLSDKPADKIPLGEIDGYVNLVFSSEIGQKELENLTKSSEEAIVYVLFRNTTEIERVLFEIDKVNHVLKGIKDAGDRVALRELESIRTSLQESLNQNVRSALFTEEVTWLWEGNDQKIRSRTDMTKLLSRVCNKVYDKAPVIKNELINKHKISGAIASARKNYFAALANGYTKEDLGFPKDKFPPEKTIYITLLKQNGMHVKAGGDYILSKPAKDSSLTQIWDACEQFLAEAKDERKPVSELYDILSKRPYKLKLGVLDFWITTFLFIRRGDYALYSSGTFKPYVNEDELYLVTRNPQDYTVKSFELNDLRLSFFNKYRAYLQQHDSSKLTVASFIESVRPILLMYRDLVPYAKTTGRISLEAQKLREAITRAQDPEKVFFDDFPAALGVDTNELLKEDHNFDDYILKFQKTITELREAYDQLLNRFETFIQQEIMQQDIPFEKYKKKLMNRFASLKEHQLLPLQKTFLQRINSPLNDRDSWLASIGQTLIGKPLTQLVDSDEEVLKGKCAHIVKELGNLSEIQKITVDSNEEEVFKIDFTSHDSGTVPQVVWIQKAQLDEVNALTGRISKELGKDKQLRIAVLAKMLKDELNK